MMEDGVTVFKCPHCGKGVGAVQSRKAQLVLEGRISANSLIAVRQTRVLLTDKPPQTQVFCPMLTIVEDVCEKCGVIFVRELRSGKVVTTSVSKLSKGG